jgi:chaperonin GroES
VIPATAYRLLVVEQCFSNSSDYTIPTDLRRRGSHNVTTATTARVSIRPLEDRIVVQAVEAETTTASGLVIPDTAKEKPQEGIVLAIGPGRFEDGQRVPLDVKEGDRVLYSKYGGTEVKYAGEEYLVLSARDVLAVIEK